MTFLWCWLAVACALVCYVQHGIADARWFKYPIGYFLILITMLVVFVLAAILLSCSVPWLSRHGWLP